MEPVGTRTGPAVIGRKLPCGNKTIRRIEPEVPSGAIVPILRFRPAMVIFSIENFPNLVDAWQPVS